MSRVNLSDVMITLAKKVGVKVGEVTVNQYDNPLKIMVGGYDNSDLNEQNAPFVWVTAADLDISTVKRDVSEFSVNVVVGLAPKKDVPSADSLVRAENDLGSVAADSPAWLTTFAAAIPAEAQYDALRAIVSSAIEDVTADVEDVIDANAGGVAAANETDTAEMIEEFTTENAKATSIRTRIVAVVAAATPFPALEDATEALSGRADHLLVYLNAAATALTAYSTAVEAFEQSPYVMETSGNLIVYGALRIFDAIRNAIVDAAYEANCGLPVRQISIAINPKSAYPLDWTQATIVFGAPESL